MKLAILTAWSLLLAVPAFGTSAAETAGSPVSEASGGPAAPNDSFPGILPDLAHLAHEAKRVQFSDMAAWSRFRFRRQVEQQRLGGAGEVREQSFLDFVIRPAAEGFDEQLVGINGRIPTPREVSQHRRQARFSRHYTTAQSGGAGGGEEAGYTLGTLLRMSTYRYAGEEQIEGSRCHRLDFGPGNRGDLQGVEGRLAEAMTGSLWITAEGFHLAQAVARTVRPVPLALSIAKVNDLEIRMEAAPVTRDIWLPSRIDVRANARVSWVPVRKHTRYLYSDFQPLFDETHPGSDAVPAAGSAALGATLAPAAP